MANEFIIKNGFFSEGSSNVTGSLTVTQGITGSLFGTASYAANALTLTQVPSSSLASGSWSFVSGLYQYTYSNAIITATSIVDVVPDNSSITIVKAADILPRTDSSTGQVLLYSTNAPTGDIVVTFNILK